MKLCGTRQKKLNQQQKLINKRTVLSISTLHWLTFSAYNLKSFSLSGFLLWNGQTINTPLSVLCGTAANFKPKLPEEGKERTRKIIFQENPKKRSTQIRKWQLRAALENGKGVQTETEPVQNSSHWFLETKAKMILYWKYFKIYITT